ncbi:hypothetical protein [Bacillus sp. ISL-45]|uniref:hypothetical protein n=1 Tax=Bacillus sp. ISL-45 TaxID=2819128 RepID=UPI001BECC1AB|nr:hypothetical protein [Bacillus sp. ISL-45]MBT2663576.1 hypothetical protein [Bacillus sp. ISL-45]
MGLINLFQKEHQAIPGHRSKNVKLITGSLLGAIAAILQSAGLFGGLGYAFSIAATGPIVLATVISARIGFLTYVVTAMLLIFLQPSEVLIFVFTTGLLGVSLGTGFKLAKNQTSVTITGGLSLASGILTLLYLFQFPVLGPAISSKISVSVTIGVIVFSLLYSFIWMRLSLAGMKYLNRLMVRSSVLEKN